MKKVHGYLFRRVHEISKFSSVVNITEYQSIFACMFVLYAVVRAEIVVCGWVVSTLNFIIIPDKRMSLNSENHVSVIFHFNLVIRHIKIRL